MASIKRFHKYILFAAAFMIIFLSRAAAYSVDSDSTTNNTDQIIGNLSSPIIDFVNNARQISVNLTPRSAGLNWGSLGPGGILDQIKDWFYKETGFHIGDVFQKAGTLLVYLLTAVADGVRWVLAWVR